MQKTPIGWTDWSANLLRYLDPDGHIVHACVRISEGCRFCYSCALAPRWGRYGKDFTAENMKALTPFFDLKQAQQVLKSKAITGQKLFVNDMTDLFGEWVSDEIIRAHFATFASRPDVTFQILTKRAARMREILTRWQADGLTLLEGCGTILPNVHLGVSVEDQKTADERIPLLLETPAAIRWASVEPMLSQVELGAAVGRTHGAEYHDANGPCTCNEKRRLHGIVIGGESGSGHRGMPLDSAVKLACDARAAGVSVFIKQDSGPRSGMQGRWPDDLWALKEWPSCQ